tara:strand:- start:131 stop:1408 length:1278 start_codon:yes stop_codon:yes gene_type:complete
MTIQQLIEACNSKRQQIKDLAAIEAKDGQLTAEQLKQFDTISKGLSDDEARLNRAKAAEALTIEQAQPIVSATAPAIHVKSAPADYPGAKIARFGMAIAAGKGNLADAEKFAKTELRDNDVAMAVSTAEGSGGALIPENLSSDFIELLRPKSIVRMLGASVVPLVNGSLTIPRHTGGAISGYKAENASRNAENQTLDDVKLSAKTQMTIVPISNELIGRAGRNVESIFLNDMLAATATRQDKAFIRDDGTNNTPTGMRKTAEVGGRLKAFAGDKADIQVVDMYLDSLVLALEESDSAMVRPGWGLSPRTAMYLYGLRDGNGNKVYPEMAQGMLKGYPIGKTTNIPVNLGTGLSFSEIYFADFNDVIIGESDTMTIDFSREATYNDASGNLISAYSANQSVLRLVTANDIGFRHLEGLVVGTEISF